MIATALQPRTGSASSDYPAPISEREFAAFQVLVERLAGVHLSDSKKALLTGRLARRVRDLGLPSYGAYYRRVTEDAEEEVAFLDRILTNETRFFREPRHFELLEREVVPKLIAEAEAGQRPRKLKVWSAACSTGEEPYSIAMLLAHHLCEGQGWEVEILATDLSTRVLGRARDAVWPIDKAEEIPPHLLKQYMRRGVRTQEGRMCASPEIQDLVRFQRLNLNHAEYPVQGPFDLIFCRNVMIYFQREVRVRVIERMLDHLAPGGLLFVGHSEDLHGVSPRLRSVVPTVYGLARAHESAPSAVPSRLRSAS